MQSDRAGVRAWFPTRSDATDASRRLARAGVPERRILLDANAPDQSPTPVDTAGPDVATERRSFSGGVRGLVLGALIGAVLGAGVGAVAAEVFSPAWFGFVIAGALFVMGIGLLWGMLLRTPEGPHYGTVQDRLGHDEAVPLIVRIDDTSEADRIAALLREMGGTAVEDVRAGEVDPGG